MTGMLSIDGAYCSLSLVSSGTGSLIVPSTPPHHYTLRLAIPTEQCLIPCSKGKNRPTRIHTVITNSFSPSTFNLFTLSFTPLLVLVHAHLPFFYIYTHSSNSKAHSFNDTEYNARTLRFAVDRFVPLLSRVHVDVHTCSWVFNSKPINRHRPRHRRP